VLTQRQRQPDRYRDGDEDQAGALVDGCHIDYFFISVSDGLFVGQISIDVVQRGFV
jgi:hypothetical protein